MFDVMLLGIVSVGNKGLLEKIYCRKDVRIVRSVDKWYRFGREVKLNEIFVKWFLKKVWLCNGWFVDDRDDDERDDVGMLMYIYD